VRYERVNLFGTLKFEDAKAIARAAMDQFLDGQVDSVYLVYNEFKSVMVQRVAVEQLLPIPRLAVEPAEASATPVEYLFEPSPNELFEHLIPTHVEVQVFRALLESNAAFFAAQMTAMDAATRNSGEMIESLTLYMNKVRQAAITREIIEVVSGAQAL
jgi:F-type H+-transporting ATPase subunit gamma